MLKLKPICEALAGALLVGEAPTVAAHLEALGTRVTYCERLTQSTGEEHQLDVCFYAGSPKGLSDLRMLGNELPPVVFVESGDATAQDAEDALAAGAFDVLRADASPVEILARALAARRYRVQRQRARSSDVTLHDALREKMELAMRLRSTQAELERVREDAREHERLATVGTFAAGIAHQINNPLTGVVGFGELLLERELPTDAKRDVQRMVDEAQRAARIIREMLDLTRTCTRSEMIDLNALIERTIHIPQIQRTLGEVEVVADCETPHPIVRGDAFRLQQVFQNLLENAVHALDGSPGARVTVSTRREGTSAVVKISDNGPGVPKELRNQLFQAFFTTKRSKKRRGTGLGLAVCRSIAREHSGDVFYEASSAGGACFVVRIPLGN